MNQRHDDLMRAEAAAYAVGRLNWRRDLNPGRGPRADGRVRVNRDRAEAALRLGIESVEDAFDVNLPWNAAVHWLPQGRWTVADADAGRAYWREVSRVAGWLKRAAELGPERLPLIAEALRFGQSARGCNSPATHFHFPRLTRYGAPERVEARLRKGLARARQMLPRSKSHPPVRVRHVAEALTTGRSARAGKVARGAIGAAIDRSAFLGRRTFTRLLISSPRRSLGA
jgi:hypothetical protein